MRGRPSRADEAATLTPTLSLEGRGGTCAGAPMFVNPSVEWPVCPEARQDPAQLSGSPIRRSMPRSRAYALSKRRRLAGVAPPPGRPTASTAFPEALQNSHRERRLYLVAGGSRWGRSQCRIGKQLCERCPVMRLVNAGVLLELPPPVVRWHEQPRPTPRRKPLHYRSDLLQRALHLHTRVRIAHTKPQNYALAFNNKGVVLSLSSHQVETRASVRPSCRLYEPLQQVTNEHLLFQPRNGPSHRALPETCSGNIAPAGKPRAKHPRSAPRRRGDLIPAPVAERPPRPQCRLAPRAVLVIERRRHASTPPRLHPPHRWAASAAIPPHAILENASAVQRI